MRKVVSILFFLIVGLCSALAETIDSKRISIGIVLYEDNTLPSEVQSLLLTKMKQLVSNSELVDDGLTDRFVLTAKVNVMAKDIVPTTPIKVSQTISLTLFIGDFIGNRVYSSYSLELTGVGGNETKSYIEAIKRMPIDSYEIRNFIETGKKKIINYYADNCSNIIRDADNQVRLGNYEEAIAQLVSIPSICEQCYMIAIDKAMAINDERMDNETSLLISKAKTIWMLNENYAGATNAMDILLKINPLSKSYSKVEELVNTISAKLRKIDQKQEETERKNWEFKMKQYKDNLELDRMKETNNTMLLSKLISAAESVGRSFFSNKKSNTTNIIKW